MGSFKTRKSDYKLRETDTDQTGFFLRTEAFAQFDSRILGLGDVRQESTTIESIAAIFDLAGFTTFSGRADPHLAVPEFMSAFLAWLFEKIRKTSTVRTFDDGVALFHKLPFFAKFMGDGALFLWDAGGMPQKAAMNVAIMCSNICLDYRDEFLPEIRLKVSDPPEQLRVGVARGRISSLGDARDYVGPCINVAARLQKITPGVFFCMARSGFRPESHKEQSKLVVKKVKLRGLPQGALVCLWKLNFDALKEEEQSLFSDPQA